jgi:deazaflavin-dependent oxidoreductase (nitroreductase family)
MRLLYSQMKETQMDEIDRSSYLYLTTTGWKSGKPHEIEIWYTTLRGRYYVIAERGERTHWVQNLRHKPAVSFRLGDRSFAGAARVVDGTQDPALHDEVRALSKAKYGWGDGLVVELETRDGIE